ncbi:MAG: chalcone isomerase family protein [Proteobacteria bacterium]|nr:chalcone isomerase family protein [Pseudomonadota bacterium]
MFERVTLQIFFAVIFVAAIQAAPANSKANSKECVGVTFPDTVAVDGSELSLNGMGVRRATMFDVEVYVAGLYLIEKSGDSEKVIQSNQPWALTVQFLRDVDSADIHKASQEGFEKAVGDKIGALKDRIEAFNAQMTALQKGQTLAYAYNPAKGTVITVNGTSGAPIQGADFAAALLGVSIGPESPDEGLKAGLLGQACK